MTAGLLCEQPNQGRIQGCAGGRFLTCYCSSMDKLPNKEKSKPVPQFKCQTHPGVNFGT